MSVRKKLLSDIIGEAGAAPTIETQAAILRANNTLALRQILLAALDPSVKFDVVIPTYRQNPDEPGCAGNSLYIEHRRLYIFIADLTPVKDPKRRSSLLMQILESIDRPDALLVEKVIQKDLSGYGIKLEAVNEAFPGLVKNDK